MDKESIRASLKQLVTELKSGNLKRLAAGPRTTYRIECQGAADRDG